MHRRWRDVPGGDTVRGMFPAASTDPDPVDDEPGRT
jgi:hypothetical protein